MLIYGYSTREIRSLYRVGCGALTRLRKIVAEQKISMSDWEAMDDLARRSLLYEIGKEKADGKPEELEELFSQIYQKKKRKNVHTSLSVEWKTYKEAHPDGLMYSQFRCRYRKWESVRHPGSDATAPVYREPGKFLYIDWVGDQIPLVRSAKDPDQIQKAHFLVTTIGYSSMIYAEAFENEKTPSVIDGLNHALCFYGALPQAFRPDNMKTAVTSNGKEGAVLSSAMEDFQDYYSVPVLPARPLSPKDKASVERAVQIVEVEFIAAVQGRVFNSFSELNDELKVWLDTVNSRIKTGEIRSRKELFLKFDRPNMKELPPKLYELLEYKKAKVPRDCHVTYDSHRYSVPYPLCHHQVTLKISRDEIIICDENNQQVCIHKREYDERKRLITDPSHLKTSHQKGLLIQKDGPAYYIHWAEKIGPNMKELVVRMLRKAKYPEQAYRALNGVLHMADGRKSGRGEKAAEICLTEGRIGYYAYKEIMNHLENPESSQEERKLPDHKNIRGGGYYR